MPSNDYRNVIVEVKGQIGIIYVRTRLATITRANTDTAQQTEDAERLWR